MHLDAVEDLLSGVNISQNSGWKKIRPRDEVAHIGAGENRPSIRNSLSSLEPSGQYVPFQHFHCLFHVNMDMHCIVMCWQ